MLVIQVDKCSSEETRKDIIIRPAGKGGGIVVMTTTEYIAEPCRQLDNTNISQKSMTECFYGHKSHIIHKENKPLSNHFNIPGHNHLVHLKIAIIKTPFKDCPHRKNKESFLNSKLNIIAPHGIKGTLASLL